MLTEAAQAIVDQRKREQQERIDGTRPMFDTAYTKGDFRLAEPGAECWSKTEGELRDIRSRGGDEPLGGIILEITTDPDPETGDMRRAFRCFDYTAPLWQAVTVLQESMIDPHSFTAPDWARLRRTYRTLCFEVGKKLGMQRKSNPIASRSEIELVLTAARLAAIVGQTLP